MEIATTLIAFLILAILVEFVTGIIKGLFTVECIGPIKLAPIIALVVGVAIAVLCKADIMSAIGFPMQYALASWVVTGFIISSGSTGVHELISKIRESRESVKMTIKQEAAKQSVTQGGIDAAENNETGGTQ